CFLTDIHLEHIYIAHLYNYRGLHSFPTRRSSDLQDHLRRRVDGSSPRAVGSMSCPDGQAIRHAAMRHGNSDRCRNRQCAADSREDRKSTRLNSSHVKISYAVFCLKKKRIPTTSTI